MKPSVSHFSPSLASHSSSYRSLLGIILAILAIPFSLHAQIDSAATKPAEILVTPMAKKVSDSTVFNRNSLLTPQQKKKRIWFVAGSNVIGYGGTMIALSSAWYKDYPKSKLHSFNDMPEWNQVDKVGHLYSAYIESRASMELWRWTGIDRKKRIWLGGMSGAFYQTVIEVLDGHSAEWGWSWADFFLFLKC